MPETAGFTRCLEGHATLDAAAFPTPRPQAHPSGRFGRPRRVTTVARNLPNVLSLHRLQRLN
jgi:hypothetical protein